MVPSNLLVDIEAFVAAFNPVVRDLTRRQKKMLITMHRYLDGDAFGSAIAFGLMLRKLGIDSSLLCVPFVPEKFDFLTRLSDLTVIEVGINKRLHNREILTLNMGDHFPAHTHEYGALTILDCAGFGQIPQEAWSIGLSFPHKINIDHHVGHGLDEGDSKVLNLVGACSSTSEVLFHLMSRIGIELDPEIAIALYVGVNADLRKNDIWEGNSNYPRQVVDALKRQVDIEGNEIHRQIDSIFSLDPWEQRLLDNIKEKIRFSGRMVYASFNPAMVIAAKRETDSLDNPRMPFHEFHIRLRQLMRQFKDEYRIAVLFDQMLGKVSLFDLRQENAFDLSGIGKDLGGGGHTNRAGFSFDAAAQKLLELNLIAAKASDDEIMESVVAYIRHHIAADQAMNRNDMQ